MTKRKDRATKVVLGIACLGGLFLLLEYCPNFRKAVDKALTESVDIAMKEIRTK